MPSNSSKADAPTSVGKVTPVFTEVAQEGSEKSSADAAGSLLDELVRDGARQMLAAALQAEVAANIEQFADVLDED
jgi:hypothetical protein